MRSKIKIAKPYIEECNNSDIFGKSVKLCAKITMENPNTNKIETKICYFEFEEKYKKYLCDERSDAFVMGLLSSAMELDMDIEFTSPISERLYYQLSTYYIPMLSKYNAKYPMHNVKIIGPISNQVIKNEKAVATGCSGGVDSFYTIAKHLGEKIPKSNKLTHIVFSSNGIEDVIGEKIKKIYKFNMCLIKNIAKDCKINDICCFNNLYEFYKKPFKGFLMFFTTTYGSIAYALQKLICIYYVSSGDPISEFNLDLNKIHGHDSSVFDVFTTQCMNTENMNFYSAGMEFTRIEKEEFIADFLPAQKNLTVCAYVHYFKDQKNLYNNCSFCPKCLRTIVQFYVLNKLDNFKNVFNVDEFYKHKAKYIGKMMAQNKKSYVTDTRKKAKLNNVKIPVMAYIYDYFYYKPLKYLRKSLKNSMFIRKIYYKFNIDYKIDGYRTADYEIYKEKLNKKG